MASSSSALAQLYNRLKPTIWLLKITKDEEGKNVVTYATGFSTSPNGLVLSCAQDFNSLLLSKYSIRARRLDMDGFKHRVDIVNICSSWDVCLLKVKGVENCEYANLASDGSFVAGETLLCISNPYGYVGSFGISYAGYKCVENVILPLKTSTSTCFSYDSNALEMTPQYRIMGHVYNRKYFEYEEEDDEDGDEEEDEDEEGDERVKFVYPKDLHPLLPIIQCGHICGGEGCLGSPIFNQSGDVVGMLVSSDMDDQIALHVTLLRKFVEQAR